MPPRWLLLVWNVPASSLCGLSSVSLYWSLAHSDPDASDSEDSCSKSWRGRAFLPLNYFELDEVKVLVTCPYVECIRWSRWPFIDQIEFRGIGWESEITLNSTAVDFRWDTLCICICICILQYCSIAVLQYCNMAAFQLLQSVANFKLILQTLNFVIKSWQTDWQADTR